MTNLEYEVMKKERGTLKDFFRHGMRTLADKFFSHDLIFKEQLLEDRGKADDERAVNDIISMLEKKVKLDGENFHVIVSCLKETDAMRDVAVLLEQSLQREDTMRSGQAAMLCQSSTLEEMQHHQTRFRGDADTRGDADSTHFVTSSDITLNKLPQSETSKDKKAEKMVTSHRVETLDLNCKNHQTTTAKGHCPSPRKGSIISKQESSKRHNNDKPVIKCNDMTLEDTQLPDTTTTMTTLETEKMVSIQVSEGTELDTTASAVVWDQKRMFLKSLSEEYVTPPASPQCLVKSTPPHSPRAPSTRATVHAPSRDETACGGATNSRKSTEKQTSSCEKCSKLRHKISDLEEEIRKIEKREHQEKLASKEKVESMKRELNQLQQRHREQAANISYLQIEVNLLQRREKERAERERVLTEDLSRERRQMEETLHRVNESKEDTISYLRHELRQALLQCGSKCWSRDHCYMPTHKEPHQRATTADRKDVRQDEHPAHPLHIAPPQPPPDGHT